MDPPTRWYRIQILTQCYDLRLTVKRALISIFVNNVIFPPTCVEIGMILAMTVHVEVYSTIVVANQCTCTCHVNHLVEDGSVRILWSLLSLLEVRTSKYPGVIFLSVMMTDIRHTGIDFGWRWLAVNQKYEVLRSNTPVIMLYFEASKYEVLRTT